MSEPNNLIIQNTKQWISSFIIELNLCPFAKKEMDRGSVQFTISEAITSNHALIDLMRETTLLNTNPSIETTLLIFPNYLQDFFDYLDWVSLAESNLMTAGYDGVYQLATFHPYYCFADADFDDVSNYTNRSPYPMIHLLREDSVEKAITYYGDTEKIPTNNIEKLRKLGLAEVIRRGAHIQENRKPLS